MSLTRREQILVLATLAVLALLLADYYALTPLMQRQDVLQTERGRILADIARARKLAAERRQLGPAWRALVSNGLKSDPAEAEGQLLHALRDWARECGVTLSSVKPDRPESREQLKEICVSAAGAGSMDAVAKLLWKMQSAGFPLKVMELQLSARTDGVNDLALQTKVSTLYLAPEQKLAKAEKMNNGGVR